jgi:hypothetical protein
VSFPLHVNDIVGDPGILNQESPCTEIAHGKEQA